MFQIGQEVVCVDNGAAEDGFVPPLTLGAVYTIADFNSDKGLNEGPGVRLVGVRLPARPDYYAHYFRASRFRPVRKTDISIFTAMLNKAPAKTHAVSSSD